MDNIPTGGQMCWMREDGEHVLHLRHSPSEQWQHYEEFPDYVVEDPDGFFKGITTFRALLKKDWSIIKS